MMKFSALNDEEIIKMNASTVYKVAYSMTGNQSDADDVFQSVFEKYIKKHIAFKDVQHMKYWFIRVTVNTAKTFLSSAWYRNTAELNEALEYTQNDKIDLDFALKQLSPQNRTIVYLFYYEGYKTDEIAKILKIKSNAVRTALSRSRSKLKTILEKEGYHV